MRRFLALCSLMATVLLGTGLVHRLHHATHAAAHALAGQALASDGGHCSGHGTHCGGCSDSSDEPLDEHTHHDGDHHHGAGEEAGTTDACSLCIILASLGSPPTAPVAAITPVDTLVGHAIVAEPLVPVPTPLEVVQARPPPMPATRC